MNQAKNEEEKLKETREHIETAIRNLAKAELKCPISSISEHIGEAMLFVEKIERQIDDVS